MLNGQGNLGKLVQERNNGIGATSVTGYGTSVLGYQETEAMWYRGFLDIDISVSLYRRIEDLTREESRPPIPPIQADIEKIDERALPDPPVSQDDLVKEVEA
ncbi:hypothetical protein LWI28_004363 [Acer negundo]|uniref:Uncharacterized protein n=1 Tax=Acer negundo TaxID=4023 RepID=A0AAD5NL64_ACENE|nr:hypothetical protein LWI28_004363 [Acer negundo]